MLSSFYWGVFRHQCRQVLLISSPPGPHTWLEVTGQSSCSTEAWKHAGLQPLTYWILDHLTNRPQHVRSKTCVSDMKIWFFSSPYCALQTSCTVLTLCAGLTLAISLEWSTACRKLSGRMDKQLEKDNSVLGSTLSAGRGREEDDIIRILLALMDSISHPMQNVTAAVWAGSRLIYPNCVRKRFHHRYFLQAAVQLFTTVDYSLLVHFIIHS